VIAKLLAAALLAATIAGAQIRVLPQPSKSPLITLRIVFTAGAALDPADRPGVANLAAAMLAQGGSRELAYKQILDAMFPMAASVSYQVDKEMTTFSTATHLDNLEPFYKIFRAMLLDPGWRQEDFERLRDDAVNFLRVSLRGSNDEELGKEVLYHSIFAGHPYGRHNAGNVSALERITLSDLREFYRQHYRQPNLMIAIAGDFPPEFLARLKQDFRKLPEDRHLTGRLPAPKALAGRKVTIIEKDTRSVAFSLGFPIAVRRGHPDYAALLVASSYLGQHRSSGGRLFERMRELRGLNYGDYAYIEHFPRGMFQLEPDPNLARQHQIFQLWIRPVEPPNSHFALRLALYELDRLIRDGIPPADFERTREFLSKYVNVLTKNKTAELGYRLDSLFYDIPDYRTYLTRALEGLTPERVHHAIRWRLKPENLWIVAVAKDAQDLRKKLAADSPSPVTYVSAKAKEILEEDKLVQSWKLNLRAEDIEIVPVEKIFE